MPSKTYVIELRTDHDDDSKDELVKDAVIAAAHQLRTTAQLVQDKRKPQVSVEIGDMFASNEAIDIMAAAIQEVEAAAQVEQQEETITEEAPTWERFPAWTAAYDAGYTVSGNNEEGWRFNDPDGKWSDPHSNEDAAWREAAVHLELTTK